MRIRAAAWPAIASAAILAVGTAASGTAQAASRPQARLTWARMTTMTPGQVAALQNPLLAVAGPLASVGAAKMASVFSSVSLDTPGHTVRVYLTDTHQAGRLLEAAAKADPGLDLSRVRVLKARYSAAALTRAAGRLIRASIAGRTPFPIYAANQVDNGRDLQLQVAAPASDAARAGLRAARLGGESVRKFAGVDLTFAAGRAMVPASRENDSPPFIGGDWLYGWNSYDKSRQNCTAGIPVENSAGQDGLITAGHCFTPNNGVYTENFGHYVGNTSGVSDDNDAEIVWTGKYLGGGSNADEGESDTSGNGIKYFPLVQTVDWYGGEYVCQDGIYSYENGRGVPCNMKILGVSTYTLCHADSSCTPVNGVKTASNNGNPVAMHGDSGAVVFTIHSASSRNALGMVDAVEDGCTTDCVNMSFVPQGQIMSAFGVHLNPYQ
jgi:hypothetical protein